MSDRSLLFGFLRHKLGRGLTQAEVDEYDALLDAYDKAGAIGDATAGWLDHALPLIEQFEGLRLTAYPDPGTGGVPWTIGFGSTTDEQGHAIAPGTTWTHERAEARFRTQLGEFGKGVDRLLGAAPTTPPQKAAMVSLAYNIGLTAFSRSTVLREHLAGDYAAAAAAFAMWNRAGGKVMPGLTRRRAEEAALYRSGS